MLLWGPAKWSKSKYLCRLGCNAPAQQHIFCSFPHCSYLSMHILLVWKYTISYDSTLKTQALPCLLGDHPSWQTASFGKGLAEPTWMSSIQIAQYISSNLAVTALRAERINERRDLQWLPKFQLISEGLQYLHCLRHAHTANKQDEISSWPVPLLWSFWIRLHLQVDDNLTMVGSRAHFPILAWRHMKYRTYVHCVPRNIKKKQWLDMARMSPKNVRLLPRLPVCRWV